MQHDMNNDLTEAQRELFNDPAIEAAFKPSRSFKYVTGTEA